MNNQKRVLEKKEINAQLGNAEIRKNKYISSLYKEYESYLQIVRSLLSISVEKGVHGVYLDSQAGDIIPHKISLHNFFEKKISQLISEKLPLITIEQLKINEFCNNIIHKNDLIKSGIFKGSENHQKDIFIFEEDFFSRKTLKFNINDQIPSSEYYQSSNNENLSSIDLDNTDNIKYIYSPQTLEKISLEEKFTNSLLQLLEVDNINKTIELEDLSEYGKDILNGNKIINNFELLDLSLNNLLRDLSYKVNKKLFRSNFLKNIKSEDNLNYLSNKKFLIKHPYPFVINFEINKSHFSENSFNFNSVSIFNITTVELEFKNLNLSIQRNKINELKNQFQLLLKKERYWRQKEINLNKLSR